MKQSTIDAISPILSVLRAHPALEEARPAAFRLNGRDFLHFHELPDGIVADVRLSTRFVRMPVSTTAQQADLLEQIERTLAALDAHARGRQQRRPGSRSAKNGTSDDW